MNKHLRDQLLTVSPEKLVDSLFEIAGNDKIALNKIERLVSSEKENLLRFKKDLKNIKNRRGTYFSWREAAEFAYELCELLNNLKDTNTDPLEGFKLICDFYRADGKIFDQSDDSNGNIGDVFRNDALDIFAAFALKHPDRKHILSTVVDLNEGNNYGARDEIVKNSHRFLNQNEMRDLFSLFETISKKESGKNIYSWEMESLAKQLNDAPLFEKLVYQSYKEPSGKMLTEIAEVYFSCENIQRAQEFINLIPSNDTYASYEKEKLQKAIFLKTGNNDALYNLLYQIFKKQFSESSLNELVNIAGESKRIQFVQEALAEINLDVKWNSFNAEFLITANEPEYLENYIFKHFNEINGDFYHKLLEIIKFFEKNSRYLPATMLYRSLIDSILRRAQSKYYHHGVKYLKNIDKLSSKIVSWKSVDPHEIYLQNLKNNHKLKRSFWAQYSE